MKDRLPWIVPLGALLLVLCCLLLEAGLLGGGLTAVLAVLGQKTVALVTGGLVLTLVLAG